jgi:hypothetical protein
MQWRSTQTPSFTGTLDADGNPVQVETMELVDKDAATAFSVTKDENGAKSFSIGGNGLTATQISNLATYGNVTGIKVYRVLLSQGGTGDPEAVVTLENTLGTVTWSRNDVGDYNGSFAVAPNQDFAFVENSSPLGNGNPATVWLDVNGALQVRTTADSLLSKTPIGILVYPAE